MFGDEIETLRNQMRQVAVQEEAMLRSLSESINAVEDQLLQHVREIAAAHESRRTQLLDELRGLAERMGTLPAATPPHRLETAHAPVFSGFTASVPVVNSGADWRHAARAIENDDEFVEMLQTGTG
jgi:hypothetical protein